MIIFFGGSRFVFPILDVLRKHFHLALVVTTDPAYGDVPTYCQTHKLSYLAVKKIDAATIDHIQKINAPVAVLAYFGLILPKDVLSLFPKGIINVHPSLLPKYRGPTPVQTAILGGDTITGTTIIRLDEEIDHGPILAQQQEKILPDDTTETLHERLFALGATLLDNALPQYLSGTLQPKPQDDAKATFTNHLTRRDGYIDSNNPPKPNELDRLIRAYYPWPGVWTRLRFSSYGGQAKEKVVKLLPGKMLQVEGKKPMSIKDFINGYPELKTQIAKITSPQTG